MVGIVQSHPKVGDWAIEALRKAGIPAGIDHQMRSDFIMVREQDRARAKAIVLEDSKIHDYRVYDSLMPGRNEEHAH